MCVCGCRYWLDAIDQHGAITKVGKMLSDFPVEPVAAKMLLLASEYGCQEEMLTIIAMVQNTSRPIQHSRLCLCFISHALFPCFFLLVYFTIAIRQLYICLFMMLHRTIVKENNNFALDC
jgi:HrpA-like RNA helicase